MSVQCIHQLKKKRACVGCLLFPWLVEWLKVEISTLIRIRLADISIEDYSKGIFKSVIYTPERLDLIWISQKGTYMSVTVARQLLLLLALH